MSCAGPAHAVLDALERAGSKVRGRAARWMATCPAHPDRTPSLSIKDTGERVLLHCFAGCPTEHVLDRLELTYADLFANPQRASHLAGPDMVPGKELPPEWARDMYPVEFAVLDVLLAHAFNGPTCRPSQELIAAELRHVHGWHTTRETVNRACARLRAWRFVDWHQERAPGSKWRHNVYALLCTWVRPLRSKLLKRLDSLRSSASNHYCSLPVPFSVITPHNGLGEQTYERVDPATARAGPIFSGAG